MSAVLASTRFIEPPLFDPLSGGRGSERAGSIEVGVMVERGHADGATGRGLLRGILPSIAIHGALIAILIPAMTGAPPTASPPLLLVSLATLPASPSQQVSAAPLPSIARQSPSPDITPRGDLPRPEPMPTPSSTAATEPAAPASPITPTGPVTPKPTGAALPADRIADLSPLTRSEAMALQHAEQLKPQPAVKKVVQAAKPMPAKPAKSSVPPASAQPPQAISKPVASKADMPPPVASLPTSTATADAAAMSAKPASAIVAPAATTASKMASVASSNAPVLVTDPNYAGRCHFKYPESARRRNLEGTVVIRALIDTDGKAASVTIISSSGFDLLDAAARRAISDCAFTPQRVDGRPVQAIVDVPIPFKLI